MKGLWSSYARQRAWSSSVDELIDAVREGLAWSAEMTYGHPRYTFETLAGQQAVEASHGKRQTFYGGAHLGHELHEDGQQWGTRVARRFGIEL